MTINVYQKTINFSFKSTMFLNFIINLSILSTLNLLIIFTAMVTHILRFKQWLIVLLMNIGLREIEDLISMTSKSYGHLKFNF